MLAVSIIANFGAGDLMMVAAVAGEECNLELGQFHHQLQAQNVGEELLRTLKVAHLNYDMSNSVWKYHWLHLDWFECFDPNDFCSELISVESRSGKHTIDDMLGGRGRLLRQLQQSLGELLSSRHQLGGFDDSVKHPQIIQFERAV